MVMTTVQELLKSLRKAARLSQDQLAKLVGTEQPQVSKWERGKLRLGKEWAEKLAPYLKTEAERLLFPEGSTSVGFDERLHRLSKVNWLPADEFDHLVNAIDTILRLAEDRDPARNDIDLPPNGFKN
jgi:transcriptional regulator with XRE-family HTH domain